MITYVKPIPHVHTISVNRNWFAGSGLRENEWACIGRYMVKDERASLIKCGITGSSWGVVHYGITKSRKVDRCTQARFVRVTSRIESKADSGPNNGVPGAFISLRSAGNSSLIQSITRYIAARILSDSFMLELIARAAFCVTRSASCSR